MKELMTEALKRKNNFAFDSLLPITPLTEGDYKLPVYPV